MSPQPLSTDFADYVRTMRKKRGLSQRDLAAKCGLDYTYLSKIENARLEHTPSIRAIQNLAKALDVDELELMDRANKVPAVFEAIARDREALRFFRRATETIKRSSEWRELNRYLDRSQKRARTSDNAK